MRHLGFLLPALTSATALSLSGCLLFATGPLDAGGPAETPDAGMHIERDAGDRDLDAGIIRVDAGPTDAGGSTGPNDAGPSDAGPNDAGPNDAGPNDAGPVCGNNELETGEACDDGNRVDDDYCTNDCEPNGLCGDGEVQAGIEECDDANQNEADYCSNACLVVGFCGDGIIQSELEECEASVAQIGVQCAPGCRVWWNLDYAARIAVDVTNSTGANLSNVPVAVSIPGSVQSDFDVAAGQVCVKASDHMRRLRAEFEFIGGGADGDSVMWMRVQSLPPGETRVFLYGSPTAENTACPQDFASVFTPMYDGVWHMESTSPQDRSGRSNNATPFGNPSVTTGVLGSAVQTGFGAHVRVDNAGQSLGFLNSLSVEAWVRLDIKNTDDRSAIFQLSPHLSQNPEVFLMNLMHSGHMRVSWKPNGPAPNESDIFDLNINEWHHYAWVRNSAAKTVRFYRDGMQLGAPLTYANSPTTTSGNSRFRMGGAHHTDWSLDGAIDEVRISNEVLSPEWIRFQVDMMSGDEVVVGLPELVAGP